MVDACLGANELGRTAQMREALVAAHVLPADFDAGAFAQWKGPKASAVVRLRQISGLRECVFTAAPADATRRDALRALLDAAIGRDWPAQDEWRSLAAELRLDREAMLAQSLPPRQNSVADLAPRSGRARQLGIADDARLKAHFADQRTRIDGLRAALPAALAKENLALLPGAH